MLGLELAYPLEELFRCSYVGLAAWDTGPKQAEI